MDESMSLAEDEKIEESRTKMTLAEDSLMLWSYQCCWVVIELLCEEYKQKAADWEVQTHEWRNLRCASRRSALHGSSCEALKMFVRPVAHGWKQVTPQRPGRARVLWSLSGKIHVGYEKIRQRAAAQMCVIAGYA
eukprot:5996629-Amphidinium_carterae.1